MRVRRCTSTVRSGRRARADAGFSLIELIVSLTIFSLLIGTLVTLIATGLQAARTNKDRSVAAHLASQDMDAIRQESFSSITIGQSTKSVTVNGVKYRIRRNITWVANNSTSDSCDSTGTSPQVLRATVTVRWPDMRNTAPVTTSTEITPPVGSYDPDNGHIAVRVRDRNATALGGIPVRVTGPGVDTTETTVDDSGCAFFAFLTPSTYSVTLGSPGYVDRQGATVPTQTVGVSAATVTSVAFDYDQAATVAMTLTGARGGIPAPGTSLTIANTGLLPSGIEVIPGTGVARVISNLFPFSDGYEAWAGTCADADPQGVNGAGSAFWPGAQRDDAISVDPGASTAATLTLPTLDIQFQRVTPGPSASVIAVHAPDNGCSAGETLTLTAFSGTNGSQLVALPYGTWSIQVVGATPSGSWPTAVMDPTQNTNVHVTVALP